MQLIVYTLDFLNSFFRCKMCGFKSQCPDTFADHAYYHLHGSDGTRGLTNCGGQSKPHDVADCTVVKGMINLLKKQREGELLKSSTTASAIPINVTPVANLAGSLVAQPAINVTPVIPLQPATAGASVQRVPLLLLPQTTRAIGIPPVAYAGQTAVTTNPTTQANPTPQPIVIEPETPASPEQFPPYQSQNSNTSEPTPIVIEPIPNERPVLLNSNGKPFFYNGAGKTPSPPHSMEVLGYSNKKTPTPPPVEAQNETGPALQIASAVSLSDKPASSSPAAVNRTDVLKDSRDAGKKTTTMPGKESAADPKMQKNRSAGDAPLVSCTYKDGNFVCNTCKYSCPAVRPLTFRRHLWKDLHPKQECTHCSPEVTFNRFRHCPLLNRLMGLLDKAMNQAISQGKLLQPKPTTKTPSNDPEDAIDLDAEDSPTKLKEKPSDLSATTASDSESDTGDNQLHIDLDSGHGDTVKEPGKKATKDVENTTEKETSNPKEKASDVSATTTENESETEATENDTQVTGKDTQVLQTRSLNGHCY